MCSSTVKPRPDRSPGDGSTRHSPRPGGLRSAVIAVLSTSILAGFTLAPGEVHADITYTIDNDAAAQNGYTLSGTITTNGTLGTAIHPGGGVVKSWDIVLSLGGTTIFTFNRGDSSFAGSSFDATSTSLSVAAAGDTVYLNSTNPFLYDISWLNFGPNSECFGATPQADLWSTREPQWSPDHPIATASVPEPSSSTLLGIGCAALAAWHRRRRNAGTRSGDAANFSPPSVGPVRPS